MHIVNRLSLYTLAGALSGGVERRTGLAYTRGVAVERDLSCDTGRTLITQRFDVA